MGRLPDNAIGYDAVDAVIWTTADSGRLDPQQLRALRQYVRGGGKLACVASGEVGALARFEEMLPVVAGGTEEWSPPSLADTAFANILFGKQTVRDADGRRVDPLAGVGLPLRIGRATPKPGAVVAAWGGQGRTATPARRPRPLRARRRLLGGRERRRRVAGADQHRLAAVLAERVRLAAGLAAHVPADGP
jgi:hypothetical protein